MTDRKIWKLAWFATAAMPLALTPAPAFAQEAQGAAAPDGENDIVVTALRREQRLQDVPAAIAALDGDALGPLPGSSLITSADAGVRLRRRAPGRSKCRRTQ